MSIHSNLNVFFQVFIYSTSQGELITLTSPYKVQMLKIKLQSICLQFSWSVQLIYRRGIFFAFPMHCKMQMKCETAWYFLYANIRNSLQLFNRSGTTTGDTIITTARRKKNNTKKIFSYDTRQYLLGHFQGIQPWLIKCL